MLKRTILFILLSYISVVCIDAQRRWVVTDEDLTVWDSPQYLNKLGMIHRGYEITETGMDGHLILFYPYQYHNFNISQKKYPKIFCRFKKTLYFCNH